MVNKRKKNKEVTKIKTYQKESTVIQREQRIKPKIQKMALGSHKPEGALKANLSQESAQNTKTSHSKKRKTPLNIVTTLLAALLQVTSQAQFNLTAHYQENEDYFIDVLPGLQYPLETPTVQSQSSNIQNKIYQPFQKLTTTDIGGVIDLSNFIHFYKNRYDEIFGLEKGQIFGFNIVTGKKMAMVDFNTEVKEQCFHFIHLDTGDKLMLLCSKEVSPTPPPSPSPSPSGSGGSSSSSPSSSSNTPPSSSGTSSASAPPSSSSGTSSSSAPPSGSSSSSTPPSSSSSSSVPSSSSSGSSSGTPTGLQDGDTPSPTLGNKTVCFIKVIQRANLTAQKDFIFDCPDSDSGLAFQSHSLKSEGYYKDSNTTVYLWVWENGNWSESTPQARILFARLNLNFSGSSGNTTTNILADGTDSAISTKILKIEDNVDCDGSRILGVSRNYWDLISPKFQSGRISVQLYNKTANKTYSRVLHATSVWGLDGVVVYEIVNIADNLITSLPVTGALADIYSNRVNGDGKVHSNFSLVIMNPADINNQERDRMVGTYHKLIELPQFPDPKKCGSFQSWYQDNYLILTFLDEKATTKYFAIFDLISGFYRAGSFPPNSQGHVFSLKRHVYIMNGSTLTTYRSGKMFLQLDTRSDIPGNGSTSILSINYANGTQINNYSLTWNSVTKSNPQLQFTDYVEVLNQSDSHVYAAANKENFIQFKRKYLHGNNIRVAHRHANQRWVESENIAQIELDTQYHGINYTKILTVDDWFERGSRNRKRWILIELNSDVLAYGISMVSLEKVDYTYSTGFKRNIYKYRLETYTPTVPLSYYIDQKSLRLIQVYGKSFMVCFEYASKLHFYKLEYVEPTEEDTLRGHYNKIMHIDRNLPSVRFSYSILPTEFEEFVIMYAYKQTVPNQIQIACYTFSFSQRTMKDEYSLSLTHNLLTTPSTSASTKTQIDNVRIVTSGKFELTKRSLTDAANNFLEKLSIAGSGGLHIIIAKSFSGSNGATEFVEIQYKRSLTFNSFLSDSFSGIYQLKNYKRNNQIGVTPGPFQEMCMIQNVLFYSNSSIVYAAILRQDATLIREKPYFVIAPLGKIGLVGLTTLDMKLKCMGNFVFVSYYSLKKKNTISLVFLDGSTVGLKNPHRRVILKQDVGFDPNNGTLVRTIMPLNSAGEARNGNLENMHRFIFITMRETTGGKASNRTFHKIDFKVGLRIPADEIKNNGKGLTSLPMNFTGYSKSSYFQNQTSLFRRRRNLKEMVQKVSNFAQRLMVSPQGLGQTVLNPLLQKHTNFTKTILVLPKQVKNPAEIKNLTLERPVANPLTPTKGPTNFSEDIFKFIQPPSGTMTIKITNSLIPKIKQVDPKIYAFNLSSSPTLQDQANQFIFSLRTTPFRVSSTFNSTKYETPPKIELKNQIRSYDQTLISAAEGKSILWARTDQIVYNSLNQLGKNTGYLTANGFGPYADKLFFRKWIGFGAWDFSGIRVLNNGSSDSNGNNGVQINVASDGASGSGSSSSSSTDNAPGSSSGSGSSSSGDAGSTDYTNVTHIREDYTGFDPNSVYFVTIYVPEKAKLEILRLVKGESLVFIKLTEQMIWSIEGIEKFWVISPPPLQKGSSGANTPLTVLDGFLRKNYMVMTRNVDQAIIDFNIFDIDSKNLQKVSVPVLGLKTDIKVSECKISGNYIYLAYMPSNSYVVMLLKFQFSINAQNLPTFVMVGKQEIYELPLSFLVKSISIEPIFDPSTASPLRYPKIRVIGSHIQYPQYGFFFLYECLKAPLNTSETCSVTGGVPCGDLKVCGAIKRFDFDPVDKTLHIVSEQHGGYQGLGYVTVTRPSTNERLINLTQVEKAKRVFDEIQKPRSVLSQVDYFTGGGDNTNKSLTNQFNFGENYTYFNHSNFIALGYNEFANNIQDASGMLKAIYTEPMSKIFIVPDSNACGIICQNWFYITVAIAFGIFLCCLLMILRFYAGKEDDGELTNEDYFGYEIGLSCYQKPGEEELEHGRETLKQPEVMEEVLEMNEGYMKRKKKKSRLERLQDLVVLEMAKDPVREQKRLSKQLTLTGLDTLQAQIKEKAAITERADEEESEEEIVEEIVEDEELEEEVEEEEIEEEEDEVEEEEDEVEEEIEEDEVEEEEDEVEEEEAEAEVEVEKEEEVESEEGGDEEF